MKLLKISNQIFFYRTHYLLSHEIFRILSNHIFLYGIGFINSNRILLPMGSHRCPKLVISLISEYYFHLIMTFAQFILDIKFNHSQHQLLQILLEKRKFTYKTFIQDITVPIFASRFPDQDRSQHSDYIA